MGRPTSAWICALALGIALLPGGVPAQTLIDLHCEAHVSDVSADGTTVVGYCGIWAGAGWGLLLREWHYGGSTASAVSADGSVVVGGAVNGTTHWAALWSADHGEEIVGDGPGDPFIAVSADGLSAITRSGQLWTRGQGMVRPFPENQPLVRAASDDLSVIVGSCLIDREYRACMWTSERGTVEVGGPPGHTSAALGVSADGSVVVGSSGTSTAYEAFRWTRESGMVSLGQPGAAYDASGDGSVIVGASSSLGPFIWDRANRMQSLAEVLGVPPPVPEGSAGLRGVPAAAISNDGRTIAGFYGFAEGPWLATLDCSNDEDCDTVPDGDDNCPGLRTTNINDANGNGLGDMCECGDQTGDGHTDMNDIMAIVDVIFEREEAGPLCDTNDDDRCDVSDILGVNAKMFGASAHCARYPTP